MSLKVVKRMVHQFRSGMSVNDCPEISSHRVHEQQGAPSMAAQACLEMSTWVAVWRAPQVQDLTHSTYGHAGRVAQNLSTLVTHLTIVIPVRNWTRTSRAETRKRWEAVKHCMKQQIRELRSEGQVQLAILAPDPGNTNVLPAAMFHVYVLRSGRATMAFRQA